MFTSSSIPTLRTELSKINKKEIAWKDEKFFPLMEKSKKKIYFYLVNTKNISSHLLKISAISLIYALIRLLIFSTHLMKYIWYSPQKSKFPLFVPKLSICITLSYLEHSEK